MAKYIYNEKRGYLTCKDDTEVGTYSAFLSLVSGNDLYFRHFSRFFFCSSPLARPFVVLIFCSSPWAWPNTLSHQVVVSNTKKNDGSQSWLFEDGFIQSVKYPGKVLTQQIVSGGIALVLKENKRKY